MRRHTSPLRGLVLLVDHDDFPCPGIPNVKRTVQRLYQLVIPRIHASAAEDFPLRAVQRIRLLFRPTHPVTPFLFGHPSGPWLNPEGLGCLRSFPPSFQERIIRATIRCTWRNGQDSNLAAVAFAERRPSKGPPFRRCRPAVLPTGRRMKFIREDGLEPSFCGTDGKEM